MAFVSLNYQRALTRFTHLHKPAVPLSAVSNTQQPWSSFHWITGRANVDKMWERRNLDKLRRALLGRFEKFIILVRGSPNPPLDMFPPMLFGRAFGISKIALLKNYPYYALQPHEFHLAPGKLILAAL